MDFYIEKVQEHIPIDTSRNMIKKYIRAFRKYWSGL